jgi:NAD+ synthase
MHIGYPPEDLIQKPALIERAAHEMQELAKLTATAAPRCWSAACFVRDGALHNGVALLEGGRIAVRFKYELPNHIDEKRYFLPGPLPEPVLSAMLGLPICRTSGTRTCAAIWRNWARKSSSASTAAPEIDKDDVAHRRRAAGRADRYRHSAGLSQPRRRAGRSCSTARRRPRRRAVDPGTRLGRVDPHRTEPGESGRNGYRWRCQAGDVHEPTEHPEDIYCAMVLALRD